MSCVCVCVCVCVSVGRPSATVPFRCLRAVVILALRVLAVRHAGWLWHICVFSSLPLLPIPYTSLPPQSVCHTVLSSRSAERERLNRFVPSTWQHAAWLSRSPIIACRSQCSCRVFSPGDFILSSEASASSSGVSPYRPHQCFFGNFRCAVHRNRSSGATPSDSGLLGFPLPRGAVLVSIEMS